MMIYNVNQKEINNSSITLNKTYQVKTNDNVIHNIKISSLNDKSISGTENGSHVIEKSDIRDIKKVKVFSSIIVATVAICAVIFTPI